MSAIFYLYMGMAASVALLAFWRGDRLTKFLSTYLVIACGISALLSGRLNQNAILMAAWIDVVPLTGLMIARFKWWRTLIAISLSCQMLSYMWLSHLGYQITYGYALTVNILFTLNCALTAYGSLERDINRVLRQRRRKVFGRAIS